MRRIAFFITLAVVAVACGGGNGTGGLSEDEQEIADAIYAQIIADPTPDNPFGDAEARCFSDSIVRDFGAAELISIGLSAEAINAGTEPGDVELTDDQAGKMAVIMTDCVDFRQLFVEEFTSEGVSQSSAECLAGGFDDDLIQSLARSQLTGGSGDPTSDPAVAEQFFALITECLSFEELSNLGNS